MADICIGDINSIARELDQMCVGDANNIAREVDNIYIGDANNIAREAYSSWSLPDPRLDWKASNSASTSLTDNISESTVYGSRYRNTGETEQYGTSRRYYDYYGYGYIGQGHVTINRAFFQELYDKGYTAFNVRVRSRYYRPSSSSASDQHIYIDSSQGYYDSDDSEWVTEKWVDGYNLYPSTSSGWQVNETRTRDIYMDVLRFDYKTEWTVSFTVRVAEGWSGQSMYMDSGVFTETEIWFEFS